MLEDLVHFSAPDLLSFYLIPLLFLHDSLHGSLHKIKDSFNAIHELKLAWVIKAALIITETYTLCAKRTKNYLYSNSKTLGYNYKHITL